MAALERSLEDLLARRGFIVILLVSVIFCLLVLIAFTAKSMVDSRARALEIAAVTSQIQAQLLAEHASSQFQTIDLTLQALLEKIRNGERSGRTKESDVPGSIRRRVMFMPQIENIVRVDATGEKRYAIDPGDDVAGITFDASFLPKHRDAWIDFQIAGAADERGRFRLTFSRRIDGPDGAFGGALVAVVNPSFFRRRYEEYASSDVDAVALYDASGRIVSTFLDPALTDGEDQARFDRVGDMPLLSSVPANLLFEGGLRGGETVDAVFALYQLNHFPFHIGLAYGKTRLLAPSRLETRRHAAVIVFAALLAAVLAFLARYQVARRKRTENALRKSESRTRLMTMLREIALSANRAQSVREALDGCLPQILAYTRWPLGAAWTLESADGEERLILSGSHARVGDVGSIQPPVEGADFSAFSAFREPLWIPSLDDGPHRSALAFLSNAGMASGILAPVMRGDRVAAVLGLFTRRRREPDDDLAGVIQQALAPIGQMMERLRAEEALRDRDALYRRMFETTLAVNLLIDPQNGAVVDANPAACAFYGYPKPDMLRKTIFDINTLAREGTAAAMSDALYGRRGYFEFTHRLSSGETRHVEVYSGSMVVKGKTLLHSIIHNVTDRKRLQEELIKARKMEAAGVLAGGIAHDFNNLLSVILGNLELAKDDLEPSHPAMEVIDEAEAGAHRAKDLIRTFLVLSGSTGKHREFLDVGETLRAAIAQAPLGGDTVCRSEPAPNLPPLWADREALLLAFRNILTNADEAMPGGGTIWIKARIVRRADIPMTQTTPARETWVRIDIDDEGVGIPEERLPRIFDAYYSTKERGSQKGMGLGLATVQSIVQAHNGRIEAASTPGGASFRVYLPAADSTGREAGSDPPLHPRGQPGDDTG